MLRLRESRGFAAPSLSRPIIRGARVVEVGAVSAGVVAVVSSVRTGTFISGPSAMTTLAFAMAPTTAAKTASFLLNMIVPSQRGQKFFHLGMYFIRFAGQL